MDETGLPVSQIHQLANCSEGTGYRWRLIMSTSDDTISDKDR